MEPPSPQSPFAWSRRSPREFPSCYVTRLFPFWIHNMNDFLTSATWRFPCDGKDILANKFLKFKVLLMMGKSDIWETYPMLKLTLKISTLCYHMRVTISLASLDLEGRKEEWKEDGLGACTYDVCAGRGQGVPQKQMYPVIHPFMDDFSCVSFWELLYQFVCYYFPLGFACSLLHNKLI